VNFVSRADAQAIMCDSAAIESKFLEALSPYLPAPQRATLRIGNWRNLTRQREMARNAEMAKTAETKSRGTYLCAELRRIITVGASFMSVKVTYLFHWLSIRWPYAVATVLALFFIVLEGFPVLKGWFDRRTRKLGMPKIGLEINNLQVEPQLVTDADDIAKYDPERKRLLKKTVQQGGAEIGYGWPIVIGIGTIFVGLGLLIVWFLER
jgi:hypothetical protein